MIVKSLALLDSALLVEEGTAVSLDDIPLRYDIRGNGRPALVFVHGWCCNRSHWEAQAAYFAHQHTVVTLDLAGHGESGDKRRHWSIPAFAEDVVTVVEALDLNPVVLVGHAMGGQVIVEAARRIPERIIGLVAAEALHDVDKQLTEMEFYNAYREFRLDFGRALRRQGPNYFHSETDETLVERVLEDMAATSPEVGLATAGAEATHDLRPALRALQVPLRCINSRQTPTNVTAVQRYAPDFDIAFMSTANHFVMLEDPPTFNRLLNQAIHDILERET